MVRISTNQRFNPPTLPEQLRLGPSSPHFDRFRSAPSQGARPTRSATSLGSAKALGLHHPLGTMPEKQGLLGPARGSTATTTGGRLSAPLIKSMARRALGTRSAASPKSRSAGPRRNSLFSLFEDMTIKKNLRDMAQRQ